MPSVPRSLLFFVCLFFLAACSLRTSDQVHVPSTPSVILDTPIIIPTGPLPTDELGIPILGNPQAPIQGTMRLALRTAPTTLNPLSSMDFNASLAQSYVIESLLRRNIETYEWMPSLATDWSISEDGKVFEFTLREGVNWQDGKPFTVDDVIFSFEAIMHPENKYRTAHARPFFQSIESVESFDNGRGVRFTARDQYFRNFDSVANMQIVPKHLYEDPDEEEQRLLNRTLIGTGPYILEEFDRARRIVFRRNPNWWGDQVPLYAGRYRSEELMMRFISDPVGQIHRLVRGDLDFVAMGAEQFVQNTTGEAWGDTVLRKRVRNYEPKGYFFIGWNHRNPIFQSKKTRRALSHLVNRQLMIDKFLFGLGELATGPLHKASIYADPDVGPIEFNIAKAYQLLLEDGWSDPHNEGVLQKEIDGVVRRLSFTILEPRQDFMKFLTIFRENARRVGVNVELRFVEWSTFIKLLGEGNFDAVRLAWSGGTVDWDPKQIWHTDSANDGGSNFIAYSNPEVDRLIDEARVIMDRNERKVKLREVYRLIAEDAPYVFFFNTLDTFYGHRHNVNFERETYRYGVGTDFWWITP